MRDKLPSEVEKARVRIGAYASLPGGRSGAFLLKHSSGILLKVIASDGADWSQERLPGLPWEHVSVSTSTRCPTWEEMCWVKDLFFEPSECVVQYHPAKRDYINLHQYVLHLWKPVDSAFPMPPVECV